MKLSIGMDRNGNKVLRLKPRIGRGFSIQTNGNLPETHHNGICRYTPWEVAHHLLCWAPKWQRRFRDEVLSHETPGN